MLTLYTDIWALTHDFIRPNFELVRDADTFFNRKVKAGEIGIKDSIRFVKLLSSERKQPTRTIDMLKLSTSCKTLILADKYPDIILSNQNISEEASQYLLSLFADSNRTFLYAPRKQTLLFSLIIGQMGCSDIPFPILDFDEEIHATVVRGAEKKVCNTYGEIVEALDDLRAPTGRTSYSIFNKEKDVMGEDGVRISKCDKPGDLYCEKEGCPYRLHRLRRGFILGGQFICKAYYDGFLNSLIEVASPFGLEPTDRQYEEIYEYGLKWGLIEIECDNPSELQYSDVLTKALGESDIDNEVAVYYETEEGQPQIVGLFLCMKSEPERIEDGINIGGEMFMFKESDGMTLDTVGEEEDGDWQYEDEEEYGLDPLDSEDEESEEIESEYLEDEDKAFKVETLDDCDDEEGI